MTSPRPAIQTFVTAPLETNTYLLACGRDCWIVDPGAGLGRLLEAIRRGNLLPTRILLTHGHGDHLAGAGEIKHAYPAAPLCCPATEEQMLTDPQQNLSAPFGFAIIAPPPDELLRPGQVLMLGETTWRVLDTSGHSPGGISFYCAEASVVLTGDALFAGSVGRTDIPGASEAALRNHIRENLLSLPDETRVLPGHGPATTIGHERRANPFLTTL